MPDDDRPRDEPHSHAQPGDSGVDPRLPRDTVPREPTSHDVTPDEVAACKVVTVLAVLGKSVLPPGAYPTHGLQANSRCLVSRSFPPKLLSEKQKIDIDTTDCTLFLVHHLDENPPELLSHEFLDTLLEQAVHAVSELIVWSKAWDQAAKISPFDRQIGRVDVKFFALQGNGVFRAAWLNPRYMFTNDALAMMSFFLGNMIATPNPISHAVGPTTRRLLSCLDLFNSCFYNEALISAFALLDDLVQTVVQAGMQARGLDTKQQEDMLRAIERERLKHYTCDLTMLCGWESLEKANSNLYSRLVGRKTSTNSARNNIMHGDLSLSREAARAHLQTVVETIVWLHGNPWGVAVELPIPLPAAESLFFIYDEFGVQIEPPLPASDEGPSAAPAEAATVGGQPSAPAMPPTMGEYEPPSEK
jgi:hypothetical protein